MRLAPRSRHITACQQPIGPVPRITTVSPSLTSSISMPFSAQANGSATVARSDGRSAGSEMRFFVAIGGTAAHSAYAPGNGSYPYRRWCSQRFWNPSRHQRHSPQVRIEQRNTRSPGETPVGSAASGPTCSSTPTGSCPSTQGAGAFGSPLRNVRASVPQMPQASTRRIAPRGSSLGSSVSRTSTAFTSVMKAALIGTSPRGCMPGSGCRSGPRSGPSRPELLHQRLVRLVRAPPLADHPRERSGDRLGRLVHQAVPAHRAADRARLDGHLHPPQKLLVLEPGAAGEHDRDPVGGLDQLAERIGVARPVRLDDVGAELGAQANVPPQVLEPVLLLERLDGRVGRRELRL